MKKNNILFKSFLHKLGIITLILISIFTFSYGSSPVYANHSIGVYIDNKPLKMDVPPIIRSGRTLVPISAIGNALSCKITWNERNQSVIIRKQASIIRLSINSKLAYIDDNPMHLDYPPIIVNGSSLQNSVMGFVARYQYIETDKFPPFLGISFLTENHLKILN